MASPFGCLSTATCFFPQQAHRCWVSSFFSLIQCCSIPMLPCLSTAVRSSSYAVPEPYARLLFVHKVYPLPLFLTQQCLITDMLTTTVVLLLPCTQPTFQEIPCILLAQHKYSDSFALEAFACPSLA